MLGYVFIPCFLSTEGYQESFEEMLCLLDSFSPAVEVDEPGAAYLDAQGLELLFGPQDKLGRMIIDAIKDSLGLSARVAFGPTRLTAKAAARLSQTEEPVIVNEDEATRFLRSLPVSILPLTEFTSQRLGMLGIRTIGQFTRLPRSSLLDQFGEDAVVAFKMITAEGESRISPRETTPYLERSVELDYPLRTMEEFSKLAGNLVEQLVAALKRRQRQAQRVTLRVAFENDETEERSTQLNEPTGSTDVLLRALERLALRMGREKGVVALHISLSALQSQLTKQLGLFEVQRQKRAQLDRAVEEIRQGIGERISSKIAHHQSSPIFVFVDAAAGSSPAFIIWRGRKESIKVCNHWRVEDAWWKGGVSREYYKLITRSKMIMVVYRDCLGGGWYIEKILD